jgi:hypothetical protein
MNTPPFEPVPNLYAFFKGSWDLSRTIEDRFGRPPGKPHMNEVVGTATFEPTPPFADSKTGEIIGEPGKTRYLAYQESGLAEFAGSAAKIEVRQSYYFAFPSDDSCDVYFSYLSPFHGLGPPVSPNFSEDGVQTPIVHPCNLDMYEGGYVCRGPGRYEVGWCVKGPDKDYTSQTVFLKRGV